MLLGGIFRRIFLLLLITDCKKRFPLCHFLESLLFSFMFNCLLMIAKLLFHKVSFSERFLNRV
jgi:uncharacterized membrane protein YjdF